MKLLRLILLVNMIAVSCAVMGESINFEQIPDLPIRNIPPASPGDTSQKPNAWEVSLGGGLSYAPRYEGAANDRLRFMPLFDASYNNGKIFISPIRGIGYNFSDDRDVQYGVRINIGRGRYQNEDPRLYGMGDIRFAPEAGIFYNQRVGGYYLSSGVSSGENGTHAEAGSGYGFLLGTIDRLRIGVNFSWGDNKYSQRYFGVTASQAAASGYVFNAYDANAGMTDYALTSNWVHNFDKKWFSNTGLAVMKLVGSAELSPLTQRSTSASINALLGYRF